MANQWIGLTGMVLGLCLSVGVASAQQKTQPKPKVAEATARVTALAKVPGGRVKSYELEQEGGRLIYSYDIEVPGRPGIQEVHVDAITGAIVGGVEHEDAAAENDEAKEEAKGGAAGKAAPYGQWLVARTTAAHPEIKAVEIAIVQDGSCRTVAATAAEDVGEACDDDETGPMRTGQPDVEAPSVADPVYDITQALHDARGSLIGAVGMDITPGHMDRNTVLALAEKVRREIEAQIPSKEKVLGAAPAK